MNLLGVVTQSALLWNPVCCFRCGPWAECHLRAVAAGYRPCFAGICSPGLSIRSVRQSMEPASWVSFQRPSVYYIYVVCVRMATWVQSSFPIAQIEAYQVHCFVLLPFSFFKNSHGDCPVLMSNSLVFINVFLVIKVTFHFLKLGKLVSPVLTIWVQQWWHGSHISMFLEPRHNCKQLQCPDVLSKCSLWRHWIDLGWKDLVLCLFIILTYVLFGPLAIHN